MTERYRVNRPKIAAKEEEGEVLLFNLQSGECYSLLGIGVGIWAAIERTASTDEIESSLPSRYEGVPDDAGKIVAAFIEELRAEDLVAPATGAEEQHEEPAPRHQRDTWFLSSSGGEGRQQAPAGPVAYAPPQLKKFSNIEEFIFEGSDGEQQVSGAQ